MRLANPMHSLFLVTSILVGVLLPSCVTRGEFNRERDQREIAEKKWEELAKYQSDLESDRRALKHEVDRLRLLLDEKSRGAADASAEKTLYQQKLAELEKRLAAFGGDSIASGDIEIHRTSEGTVVEIRDGVLFDSGKKAIKEKGKELLARLAEEIAKTPYRIRIEGHTDTDPVRVTAKDFPLGNLQLSVERALEVGHFVTALAPSPIPAARVHVAGYGEHRPRAEGSTPEAKRKNRRVDIVLLETAEEPRASDR